MELRTVKERKKILTIIYYLISQKIPLSAKLQENDQRFTTRLVKVKKGDDPDSLIVEKLAPDSGNSLIQCSSHVVFSFEMRGSRCSFTSKYIGVNTQYPDFGYIVGIPSAIELEDRRREERLENGLEKFLSVEFVLQGDDKVYQLKTINLGSHGIGLVVEKKDSELLNKINVGDTIKDLKFFLPMATLTIDCIIKHKTRLTRGPFEGHCILGVESDFIINPREVEEKLHDKKS